MVSLVNLLLGEAMGLITLEASDMLLECTSVALVFLIGEIIEWFILEHDDAGWHFRFGSDEDYPNLNPLISTFKVTVIIFIIVFVISLFILPRIFNEYIINIVRLTNYPILLLLSSIIFSFLWIWHHIAGKDWNSSQYILLLVSITFLLLYSIACIILGFGDIILIDNGMGDLKMTLMAEALYRFGW